MVQKTKSDRENISPSNNNKHTNKRRIPKPPETEKPKNIKLQYRRRDSSPERHWDSSLERRRNSSPERRRDSSPESHVSSLHPAHVSPKSAVSVISDADSLSTLSHISDNNGLLNESLQSKDLNDNLKKTDSEPRVKLERRKSNSSDSSNSSASKTHKDEKENKSLFESIKDAVVFKVKSPSPKGQRKNSTSSESSGSDKD